MSKKKIPIPKYIPKYIYQRYNGQINKLEEIGEHKYIDVKTGIVTDKNHLLLGKVSENIIDLIEAEDYVNGFIVKGKMEEKVVCVYYCYSEQLADGNWLTFYKDNIKSIVTKEQFKNIEFEV